MPDDHTLPFGLGNAFAVMPNYDTFSATFMPMLVSKPLFENAFTALSRMLAIKLAISDAFIAKPDSQLLEKSNDDTFVPTPSPRKAFAKPESGASANKLAVKEPVASKIDDHKPANRNAIISISRAIMENKWQYWQYCLAPSHTEHKIYFSPMIPLNGYLNGADSTFDQVLIKAGLAHDAVQCPRAPNKPTLVFRQKYSIRFNKEIGNAIINVNWD